MAKRRTKRSKLELVEDVEPPQQELSDEELVQIFQSMHSESDSAYLNIGQITDTAWAAYNNDFDFSDKGESQSQSFLPIYKSAIRIAKSIVRRSLLEAPEYFSVEGLNKESKAIEMDVKEGLSRVADQCGFKEHVANASFAGFLENLAVLKIFPSPLAEEDDIIHPQQTIKLVVSPVSVRNDIRLDPKGRNLYTLHRSEMDLSDFELLVESGEYEKSSLEAAKADFVAVEEKMREQREQGLVDAGKPSWRKNAELWEVWTRALCRMDGTAVRRNVMFTILNRKYLCRKVTPYLYKHKMPPFVVSPISDKPFSVYHENFGESVIGMLDGITDLMNSLVDAAQNIATKGFEVTLDQVRNPSELARGIYGGKVVKTTTPPIPGLSAVRPFDVGSFSPDALMFLQWMVQQFHNGIGVTELLSGIPGVGDKTATEIKSKTAAAMGNINEVAGLLDKYLVGPSLRMMYQLILEWNPEIFGDRLAFQTDKNKLKFRFHISGISGALKQEGELQELMMIVKMLQGTPMVNRLNWDAIAKEMFSKKGFDPSDFIVEQPLLPPEAGAGSTPGGAAPNATQESPLAQILTGMRK